MNSTKKIAMQRKSTQFRSKNMNNLIPTNLRSNSNQSLSFTFQSDQSQAAINDQSCPLDFQNNDHQMEDDNYEKAELIDNSILKQEEDNNDRLQKVEVIEESLSSTDRKKNERQGHAEVLNPNVIKNIMRSFFNFLLDERNQDVIMEFLQNKSYDKNMKQIRRIVREFKFNNTYITRLLKKKGLNKLLEYYLTLEVQEWIQKSKIKDANLHFKCIEFLKECCVDHNKILSIIKYKKKY